MYGGLHSDNLAAHSDPAIAEKKLPIGISEDNTKAIWGAELIDQINEFFVSKGIPNFRRFLADTDRITAVSTNMVYYIVSPAMKSRIGYYTLIIVGLYY